MINVYDIFRNNQRIQFVFDMENMDETGDEFIMEGDSIDNDQDNGGGNIVEAEKTLIPKRKE